MSQPKATAAHSRRGEMHRCERCGTEFFVPAYNLRRGYGRFCSFECRRRRSGPCAVTGCQRDILWGDLCQWHYNRRTMVKLRYGLTLEQDEELRASGCAICGVQQSEIDGARALHIDHDHLTGGVRGALCHGCNTGLGSFGDDPTRLRAAAEYLEKHQA